MSVPLAGQHDRPVSRSVSAEFSTPTAAFNIRFVEIPIGPGEHPVLPDGGVGISDEEVVAKAISRFITTEDGRLPPGVHVSAGYGIFSDDVFAKGGPGIPMELMYQDRPAWIVTVYGPGIKISVRGPTPRFKHAFNPVFDAATGAFLGSYE